MSGNPRRHAIRPGGQPGVRLRLRLPSADPRHHRRARVDGLSVEGRKGTTMKRFGIAAAALMLVLAVVPTVDAATTWTARFSGRGLATVRVGSPTRLTLGLTGFRAGTTWTVSLRHGSCASVGTLVRSVRVKASSTGRLGGTVTLTAAQARREAAPDSGSGPLRVVHRGAASSPSPSPVRRRACRPAQAVTDAAALLDLGICTETIATTGCLPDGRRRISGRFPLSSLRRSRLRRRGHEARARPAKGRAQLAVLRDGTEWAQSYALTGGLQPAFVVPTTDVGDPMSSLATLTFEVLASTHPSCACRSTDRLGASLLISPHERSHRWTPG